MGRATILVIDDDAAVTDVFVRLLTLEGHAAHAALDGERGLREVDRWHPDAILLDLRMPVVDGLEFMRRLRARPAYARVPVAIITGDLFVSEEQARELEALGAAMHLKPVQCEDLVQIAQDLVRAAETRVRIEADARRTLLLVDDSIAQRDQYEMGLELQFHVLTASRGIDCLTIAARAHPDVIVLDVMMPGLDGWETCRRLKSRADTAGIPVIFLTGQDEGHLEAQAAAVGGSVVLSKPCPIDTLLDTISRALVSQSRIDRVPLRP